MPPTSPGRSSGERSQTDPWWVNQQHNQIWLEQSAVRPVHEVPRGVKHIVVAFGPATREACVSWGDRFVRDSAAVWREQPTR